MKKVLDVLNEIPEINSLNSEMLREGVYITGCVDSQKAHVAEFLRRDCPLQLIVTENESRAEAILGDCEFFGASAFIYPAKDMFFYSADIHGNQIIKQRLLCIDKIADVLSAGKTKKKVSPLTIITTVDALQEMLIPISVYGEYTINIKKGDEIDRDEIISGLVRAGYEVCGMVNAPGQLAIRGGILDVYPVNEENPVRIELFGDEIEKICVFDVDSQRSISEQKKIKIFPASESLFDDGQIEKGLKKLQNDIKKRHKELEADEYEDKSSKYERLNHLRKLEADISKENRNLRDIDFGKYISYFTDSDISIADYFPSECSLITWDEPARLEMVEREYEKQREDALSYRYNEGYIVKGQRKMFFSMTHTLKHLSGKRQLLLSVLGGNTKSIRHLHSVHISAAGTNSYNNSFDEMAQDLERNKSLGFRTVLVTGTSSGQKRLLQSLQKLGFDTISGDDFAYDRDDDISNKIYILKGALTRGFSYPDIKYSIITENDVYTAGKRRREKIIKRKPSLDELDLCEGDYVVHDRYGIGVYRGIFKQTVDGAQKDYIRLDYANDNIIYILASQTDLIKKYASKDAENIPKLSKPGSSVWEKAKEKAMQSAQLVAADLVRLYAARSNMKGFCFSKDTVWQKEFEESFPYEETKDQLDAIDDVKRDMESPRIMDRLICGDVGFGKTEVAIRAAFKAVQDGKQVAVLAPTTLLAGQHFDTFSRRLRAFPVNVGLLSGMRTPTQNARVSEDLRKGLTDIVIGTHRLLSKDVEFSDLGLLVIDEEQRFGVAQKEKIKKLKENVDVLALSATPIPRTLNMSLAGIRDMSTLEEPPVERKPVQTFVTESDDGIIREAVTREVARGGQVYFIYNSVIRIEDKTVKLQELLPDVRIAYAHGRMDKRLMEKIMTDFINGNIDVLVATTIVETGLDISNVNTIIIENAENFGLAQLYQLRGRVGRSARRAYAFLLYSRDRLIKETALKRLTAINEMTSLGSGYRLAMRDLEIRGAGAMLGKVQHGHISAVGFDLYTRMLSMAVAKQKGMELPEIFETAIYIDCDAFLSDRYVPRESQKLELYKRIAAIETKDEMNDLSDELRERYGPLPVEANNLLMIAYIKALAHRCDIIEVRGRTERDKKETYMYFKEKGRLDDEKLMRFALLYGNNTYKANVNKKTSEIKRIMIRRMPKAEFGSIMEYMEELASMLEALKDFSL